MKSTRPKLSQFLQEVCKEDLGESGAELFGPDVRKKILERANTIDAFNKALTKVESSASRNQPSQSRFLERGSGTRYGSGSSRNPSTTGIDRTPAEVETEGTSLGETGILQRSHSLSPKTNPGATPSRRSSETSHTQLATDHRQPMDTGNDSRIPIRIQRSSSTGLQTTQRSFTFRGTAGDHGDRDTRIGEEECDRSCLESGEWFLQSSLCCTEKRWGMASHYKSQEAKSLSPNLPLHDGEYFQCQGRPSSCGLLGENRFERCVSYCTYFHRSSQVPSFQLERETLSVQVTPLWSGNCTESFLETPTALSSSNEEDGHSNDHIFG